MTRVHPLAPVVGMDIDGNLGDYHKHFYRFLRENYFPHPDDIEKFHEPYWWDSDEFSKALGMDKSDYRKAKLAYRMGGMKRCLPLFEVDVTPGRSNAIRLMVQEIRESGVQVWICTQRPWLSLTTVDEDTQYWLDRYVGKVDGLIYGEDKYADLVDIVGRDRVLGVVEDLPECLRRAKDLGLRTAMRVGKHNENWYRNYGESRGTIGFSRANEIPVIVKSWKEGI